MGKRLKFILLVVQTFVARHKKYIAISVFAGFLFTLLLLNSYPLFTEFLQPKRYVIGVVGKYTDKSLPPMILNQISVGLTSLTSTGEASGSAASNWEIQDEGKLYTFHLKPLLWQDGKKLVASDINYQLSGVELKAADDSSLQVRVKDPFAALPTILARPLLRPNLIGLGNYKVKYIRYKEDIISELLLEPVVPGFTSLHYRFYNDTPDAILAFKLGEINILSHIVSIEDLSAWKNISIEPITLYDRYVGVFFNHQNQLFKEKEVRQALSYAVGPFPSVEKAYSPISPFSWAYTSKIRLYKYDTDTAVKILDKNPISSSSSVITISTLPSLIQTAQKIADDWKKVGVNTRIKVENSIPPDYDVFVLAQPIPSDPDQYQYWQSKQDQTNITHYNNVKIDKLLEDGRKTIDKDKRAKIYEDFQRYLVDDAPVIFLYHPKVYDVKRNRS